jgi:hypothetical protein
MLYTGQKSGDGPTSSLGNLRQLHTLRTSSRLGESCSTLGRSVQRDIRNNIWFAAAFAVGVRLALPGFESVLF